MKRVKKRKAALGTILAIGSGLASILSSAINAGTQKKINEENNKRQLFADNQTNAFNFATNLQNVTNADIQNELEEAKLNTINTINNPVSQFKCGGRKRMKLGGRNVTSDINRIIKYK